MRVMVMASTTLLAGCVVDSVGVIRAASISESPEPSDPMTTYPYECGNGTCEWGYEDCTNCRDDCAIATGEVAVLTEGESYAVPIQTESGEIQEVKSRALRDYVVTSESCRVPPLQSQLQLPHGTPLVGPWVYPSVWNMIDTDNYRVSGYS